VEALFPGLYHVPNLHPLFVHFPVVLWVLAPLFLVVGTLRDRAGLVASGRWLLYLGAAASVIALATGYLATDAMDHNAPGHEFVHYHKNFMIAAPVSGAVAAAAAFALRRRAEVLYRWIVVGLAVGTMATTMLGADRGAELVYRHGIGTPGAAMAPADAAAPSSTHGD